MEWTPLRIRRFRDAGLCQSQHDFAKTLGFEKRTIGNAERGAHPPSLTLRRALDQALEHASDVQRARFLAAITTEDQSITSPAHGTMPTTFPRDGQVVGLRELVLNAAHSSAILHSTIDAPKVEDRTLGEAQEDLRSLATDYVVNPELTHMVPNLVILRDRLYVLLVRYGKRPVDARELNLLLGATCVLLASVSHDLGEPGAAMVHTRAALAFAELAGHSGLITWVYCTRASVASWSGSADDVLHHAQRARAVGLSGVGAIRLAGLEARALARSGQRQQVVEVLRAAHAQRDKLPGMDSLRDVGEAFTFSAARQHYYNAAAYAHMCDWEAVEREASRVISLYSTPETGQCWPVTMTLSRVYLAQARLSLSSRLEGSRDALTAVFEMPDEQRIPQIVQALNKIQVRLRSKAYANLPAARGLDEEIRNFRAVVDNQECS